LLAYRRDELRKPKSLFGPSPPDTDYVSNGRGFLLMAGTGFPDRKKMRETSPKDEIDEIQAKRVERDRFHPDC
jgi:hypothetical protein